MPPPPPTRSKCAFLRDLQIVIILEELGLPYIGEFIEFVDLKKPGFEAINPNGRVPAIHDPNTDITLWESGAIVAYLIDKYDPENKISYKSSPEKYLLQQWEHFQSTGQGPYFGQAAWFLVLHHEPLPSAQERYINETKRIAAVLDKSLNGRDWLVGDKITFADLAFVAWNGAINIFMKDRTEWNIDEYPNFKRWQEAMLSRPSVTKAVSLIKVEDVKSG